MEQKTGLLPQLGFLLAVSLLSFYPAVALYIDVVVLDNQVKERSVTEFSQAMCLLIAFLVFARSVLLSPKSGFYYLVAGFFLVLLIRENDAYLDAISHGFWLYPALLVTGISIFKAFSLRGRIMADMADFLRSASGVYISVGMISVLFFSRVIGTSKLWHPIMGDAYAHTFKSAIQEGTELYGYLIILAGALLMAFTGKLQRS